MFHELHLFEMYMKIPKAKGIESLHFLNEEKGKQLKNYIQRQIPFLSSLALVMYKLFLSMTRALYV